MEFRILGPLEVLEGGRQVDLGGAKQRALLAILLLHANEVVSTNRLIEALWEEQPPGTAQKALQVYISQLRKALGKERLETKPPGYRLRVDTGELDLERFQLLADDQPHEALSLWRGPPLAEFAYQRFAQVEMARLEELRLTCLEQRIEVDLELGKHAALVGDLERLVREHPLRERLRALLMLALYRSGRQAEALEAYQNARRTLTEELGIEPSQELRELQQAILRQDPTLTPLSAGELAADAETLRGAFVGREAELEALRTAVDVAFAGHGRLLLLVGEPGIGKSRLADEVIRHAGARGARVLVGRCWEAGGAPAYWPWLQSLRAYVRQTGRDVLEAQIGGAGPDLAQLLPELRELVPELGELPELESEAARFRLFDAMSSFLKNAARDRPLVIVLDDLHAADEPSLLLLRFVARELGDSRILVLGAYRDVDPTPTAPLTMAVTELVREPVTVTVELVGLHKEDVARFVELISGEEASDELVTTIHDETEGNPLFVGEIVRLLAAEGGLDAAAGTSIVIPQTVRDVIARRLRHLSEECNRILVLAAVLGREFGLDALVRMADVKDMDLFETLDEAISARVVSEIPGSTGRLRFAHVLIRDTLYDGLTVMSRVRHHRLAVDALETIYGTDAGTHLAELAFHAVAGGDGEKGVEYARRAGDDALALLAYEEAARLYTMALSALDVSTGGAEALRCELLLALGEAQGRAGNAAAAKDTFLEAGELARRRGFSHQLARAAAGYGGRIVWARAGEDGRLVPLLEEALEALGDQDLDLRARLLARLSGALRDEVSRARRDAVSDEAVELARRIGRPSTLAYALAGRGAAIIAPDTVDECFAIGTELCDLATEVGETEAVVDGHYHRLIAHLELGRLDAALLELEAMNQVAEALRQPAQLWQVSATRAMIALGVGAFEDARALISQALAIGERAQGTMAIPAFRLHRFMLDDFEGRLEQGEDALADSVRQYPARPVLRCALAYLHARLGRAEKAQAVVDDLAGNDFSALPFDFEWLYATSLLAEACALVGDEASEGVLYNLLLPYAGLNVVDAPEGMRGPVARYLGILGMRTRTNAERHFENAIEMNRTMGTRPWLAHAQEDYAQMLLIRAAPGDAERADHLLDEALATYRELGMTGSLERARSLAGV